MFTEYRKTHNQGVFDVYTKDILNCRKSGVLTGLPDAYGRGRIIGDYRRVALYGIDFLMADKLNQFKSLQEKLENGEDLEMTIQLREEIAEQHRALAQIKEMAAKYGYDISGPATSAQEAVQWTYFGYLAAVKSQNGAAMSFGRVSTFPRRVHRARHQGGQTDRRTSAGTDRPPGDETAYGALPAYP